MNTNKKKCIYLKSKLYKFIMFFVYPALYFCIISLFSFFLLIYGASGIRTEDAYKYGMSKSYAHYTDILMMFAGIFVFIISIIGIIQYIIIYKKYLEQGKEIDKFHEINDNKEMYND